MDQLDRVISLLTVVALFVFLTQLYRGHSVRRFKLLFIFLTVLVCEDIALLIIPLQTNLYAKVYYVSQALNLLVACGVVREIYRLALGAHPALASFGDSVILWALTLGLLLSLLGLKLDDQVLPGQFVRVHRFLTFERSGNAVLLFLLLTISAYLSWFPVKLSRNVFFYAAGFTLIFAERSLLLLAINVLPQSALRSVSNAGLGVELICLIFMVWGFRAAGADELEVVGHRWNPLEMERLGHQLDSINSAVERLGRSRKM